MKIRFIVEIDAGEYTFVIDTNNLPSSVGCRQVALKDFEIIEPKSSGQNRHILKFCPDCDREWDECKCGPG